MGCSDSAASDPKPALQEATLPKIQQPPPPPPQTQTTANFLFGQTSQGPLFFKQSLNKLHSSPIPKQFTPHNLSTCTLIAYPQYLITGGVTHDLSEITNKCFIYNYDKNQIKLVSEMSKARYTHNCLVMGDWAFIAGGRYYGDDQEAILDCCEKYHLKEDRWVAIAPMNSKRCTGFLVGWAENVYVFGGYTGKFQRKEAIEKYNPSLDKWQILPFQLNRGIESAFLLCSNPNQITIFGGNTNSGPTASVVTIDFQQQTVQTRPKMKQQKFLHKCFRKNNELMIFGGGSQMGLEIYDIVQGTSKVSQLVMDNKMGVQEFQSFSQSQQSVIIPNKPSSKAMPSVKQPDETVLILGTTQEPFVFQFNAATMASEVYSLPLDLCLTAGGGGIKIGQSCSFLLFGGCKDDFYMTATSQTYIYDHKQRKGTKCSPMNRSRFGFGYVLVEGLVYVFGGGNNDHQEKLQVIKECEVFSIKDNYWKKVESLPMGILHPNCLQYKSNIYIFGGTTQDKSQNIRVFQYSITNNKWRVLGQEMKIHPQSSLTTKVGNNLFYFYGGKNAKISQAFSVEVVEDNNQIQQLKTTKIHQFTNPFKNFQPYLVQSKGWIIIFSDNERKVEVYEKDFKSVEGKEESTIRQRLLTSLQYVKLNSLNRYLLLSQLGN